MYEHAVLGLLFHMNTNLKWLHCTFWYHRIKALKSTLQTCLNCTELVIAALAFRDTERGNISVYQVHSCMLPCVYCAGDLTPSPKAHQMAFVSSLFIVWLYAWGCCNINACHYVWGIAPTCSSVTSLRHGCYIYRRIINTLFLCDLAPCALYLYVLYYNSNIS